jgi:hypothetical protein
MLEESIVLLPGNAGGGYCLIFYCQLMLEGYIFLLPGNAGGGIFILPGNAGGRIYYCQIMLEEGYFCLLILLIIIFNIMLHRGVE